jgi:peroxiredoxin
VVGVSVDSVHSHRVFAEMNGFPMPLVSDFNKEISEAYGVRVDRGLLKGICHRSIFVIGRDGKISYVWKQEPRGPLPVNDDVRAAIRAVKAESKN